MHQFTHYKMYAQMMFPLANNFSYGVSLIIVVELPLSFFYRFFLMCAISIASCILIPDNFGKLQYCSVPVLQWKTILLEKKHCNCLSLQACFLDLWNLQKLILPLFLERVTRSLPHNLLDGKVNPIILENRDKVWTTAEFQYRSHPTFFLKRRRRTTCHFIKKRELGRCYWSTHLKVIL